MRLRERDKRQVRVFAYAGAQGDRYIWEECAAIRAAVYPLRSAVEAREAGERMSDMRLLLCDEAIPLAVGMGVCVEAADGRPDFRITALETWDHARATLERIAEGRRG